MFRPRPTIRAWPGWPLSVWRCRRRRGAHPAWAGTGRHARFQVRGKTFAYYLDNHHGDGIVALSCKAAPGVNGDLAAADPERFSLPAYLAHQGWLGLRLDGGAIDWDEVAGFVVESYRLVAPKRLAAQAGPAATGA